MPAPTPVGVFSGVIDLGRDIVAASDTFQEATGAEDAEEAMAFVFAHTDEVASRGIPFAVVSIVPAPFYRQIAGGSKPEFIESGKLLLILGNPVTDGYSTTDAMIEHFNFAGKVIEEIAALSGTPNGASATQHLELGGGIDLVDYWRVEKEERVNAGDYACSVWQLNWGFMGG
ncbi:MAG: hypothetical protein AMXMBFR84_37830 [Candidatus Hydrogenedentota bacterium]